MYRQSSSAGKKEGGESKRKRATAGRRRLRKKSRLRFLETESDGPRAPNATSTVEFPKASRLFHRSSRRGADFFSAIVRGRRVGACAAAAAATSKSPRRARGCFKYHRARRFRAGFEREALRVRRSRRVRDAISWRRNGAFFRASRSARLAGFAGVRTGRAARRRRRSTSCRGRSRWRGRQPWPWCSYW